MITPIAVLNIAAPGTPVRCTSTQSNPGDPFACHGVSVQTWKGNTGRVYIGTVGMNKATGENVLAVLAIPTDNTIPSWSAALTLAPNAINLSMLYVDADVADSKVLVGVLVA